ncbi:MAG: C45 family autoproteolytic acyltransferase/hydolase [Chloroflexi bacterium OHK40]
MFPELTVTGVPYERGRAYGAAVAPLICHSIASYARLFALRRGLDWAASQDEARRYRPLLLGVAPDLLEEMRGIADGAGREPDEILALNVRTELMAGIGAGVYHPEGPAALARNRAAGVPQHPEGDDMPAPGDAHLAGLAGDPGPGQVSVRHPVDDGECTTAAASGAATAGGETLLAQTWDWQGDQRAACVLLRVRAPGEPELLTMTEAGMLAKVGLNSAGLAVSLNLLRSRDDGREVGMPVHVLLRKMLQARSFAEARAAAHLAPAAGSSCITLASADGAMVSLELTPGGVAAVEPEQGLLAHANHCVDPVAAAGECPIEPPSTTRERHGRAWELLRAARGAIDVALLQSVLRDHDGDPRCICRHPDLRLPTLDRGESVCGIVLDLGAGVMHVAPGVPCTVPFTAVAL